MSLPSCIIIRTLNVLAVVGNGDVPFVGSGVKHDCVGAVVVMLVVVVVVIVACEHADDGSGWVHGWAAGRTSGRL